MIKPKHLFLGISFANVILFTALFVACTKEDAKVGPLPPKICTGNESFETDIKPIIMNSCYTGCHDGSSPFGQGHDFTSGYSAIKADVDASDNNSNFKYRVFDDKGSPMPPATSPNPALTASDLQKIKCWLDNGAKP